MEDSLSGIIKSFAVITIFIMGIMNFIILFPVEQGYTFSESDNNTYLAIQEIVPGDLSDTKNTLNTGFEKWDIEVGFMGSNTQKASESEINTYTSTVMTSLNVMVKEIFTTSDGSAHPMTIIMSLLIGLLSIISLMRFWKFVRTGN